VKSTVTRRGFDDEVWRLAHAGDATGLRAAADLLLEGREQDLAYEGHRARAFALAVEGSAGDALEELERGRTRHWPFPVAHATDIARIHFLAGDYGTAVTALQPAIRGVERLDAGVRELLGDCVRRGDGLRGRALRAAIAGGTPGQRLAAAVSVLRR
jgi:hypothetical protein